MVADGDGFLTRPVATLLLGFDGIAGDRHAGPQRRADARTPWHKRGTRIANTRQVSMVSREECREVAESLGLAALDPAWLGANLVLDGIPAFSGLPPATRLQFPSGATIFVTEENTPCRLPGGAIVKATGRRDVLAKFVAAASGRRGLVGLVERPGILATGDLVTVVPAAAHGRPAPTVS